MSSALVFNNFVIFILYSVNSSIPSSRGTVDTPGPDSDGEMKGVKKGKGWMERWREERNRIKSLI